MNIIQIQDDLKGIPDQELISEVQNPSGVAPVYLLLGELQRREKMRAEYNAEKPTETVAEQLIEEAIAPNTPQSLQGPPIPPGPGKAMPPQPIPPANQVMPPNIDPTMLASSGVGALPAPNVGQYSEGGVVGFANGGMFNRGISEAEKSGLVKRMPLSPENVGNLVKRMPLSPENVGNLVNRGRGGFFEFDEGVGEAERTARAVRPEIQTAENYNANFDDFGLSQLLRGKKKGDYLPPGALSPLFKRMGKENPKKAGLMRLLSMPQMKWRLDQDYAQGGVVGFKDRGTVNYPRGTNLTYPFESPPEITEEEFNNLRKAREANYPANMPGIQTYDFTRDDYGTIDGSAQGPANDPYTGALSENVVPYQFRAADAANEKQKEAFNSGIGAWVEDEETTSINPMTGEETTGKLFTIDPLREFSGNIQDKLSTPEAREEARGQYGYDPRGGDGSLYGGDNPWRNEEGELTMDPAWEAAENLKNLWRGRGKSEDVTEEVTEEVTKEPPKTTPKDKDAEHWRNTKIKQDKLDREAETRFGIEKGSYQKLLEKTIADSGGSNIDGIKGSAAEMEKLLHDMNIYDNKADERAAKVAARIQNEQSRAGWNAVTMAGLSMMQGESQFALTNIGKGIEDGIGAYEKSEQKIADLEDKKLELEEKKSTREREKKIQSLTLAVDLFKSEQSNISAQLTAAAELQSKASIANAKNTTSRAVAYINADSRQEREALKYTTQNYPIWNQQFDNKYPDGMKINGKKLNKNEYQLKKDEAWANEIARILRQPTTLDMDGTFIESEGQQ